MRRMIDHWLQRLRLYLLDLRIADLEDCLSELLTARQLTDAEIDQTVIRLLAAQVERDKAGRREPLPSPIPSPFSRSLP